MNGSVVMLAAALVAPTIVLPGTLPSAAALIVALSAERATR